MLPEVRLVWSSTGGKGWESDQYFYLFKNLAYSLLTEPPQALNPANSERTTHRFRSCLCIPFSLMAERRGILIFSNPITKEFVGEIDLINVQRILIDLHNQQRNVRQEAYLALMEQDQRLMENLSLIIDLGNSVEFQINSLAVLLENEIQCEIVTFLFKEQNSSKFTLKASNQAGRKFWDNQSDFLQTLASRSVKSGWFSESYGGKNFKGRKFGLDQLETALIFPMSLYLDATGAFVLLNKKGRRSFTDRDVRIIRMAGSLLKSTLSRNQEREHLTSLLERFVSKDVSHQILENPAFRGVLEERRPITSLFIDLNNFTSFTENTDPSIVARQINLYFEEMTNLIVQFGGTLDKYLGDGILAMFGATDKLSSHSEKAMECAIEMQKKMAEIGEFWSLNGLTPMTASVGLCSGDALVGTIGSDKLLDYTAIGDTVNVASRLSDLAESNAILVAESSWIALQDVLEYTVIPGLKLKGRSSTVSGYEIHGICDETKLQELLKSPQKSVQLRVLRAIGNLKTYRNYDGFLSLAEAEDPEIREAVLDTIAKINNEAHIPILVQRLQIDKDLEKRILEVLGGITSDPLRPLFQLAFQGIDESVQSVVLQSTLDKPECDHKRLFLALMRSLQDPIDPRGILLSQLTELLYQSNESGILAILMDSLAQAQGLKRRAILWALGKVEMPQSYVAIARGLAEEIDQKTRIILARSIAQAKQKELLPILAHHFRNFPWWRDWISFVELLKETPDLDRVNALLHHQDPFLKYAAVILLNRLGTRELDGVLIDLLKTSEEGFVEAEIIKLLQKAPTKNVIESYLEIFEAREDLQPLLMEEFGNRQAFPLLYLVHQSLKADDEALVNAAIITAGKFADPSSLPLLLELLADSKNANLSATVLQNLGSYEASFVEESLIASLHSPVARIRANAVEALMECNALNSIKRLEPLLQDDNNRVRANAALACFRLGHTNAIQILVNMSKSPNKWMRLSCLWALNATSTDQAHDTILNMLHDPDYDVVMAAARCSLTLMIS